MKKILLLLLFVVCASSAVRAGQVGLPLERIALPELEGNYYLFIWDENANNWYQDYTAYDGSGSVEFQCPAWGRRYWVGLWDADAETYIFGRWIGHTKTDVKSFLR